MDNIVKSHIVVQLVEYGTQLINNVSVLMATIGQDIIVYLLLNVMVDNTSILLFLNVFAFQVSNGMVNSVYNARMAKHGILQVYHVHAHLVLSKLRMAVFSINNAQVVNNGIKMHGLVNVLLSVSGMETIVLLILALVVDFGMTL